ncbi:MAG: fructose-bisphosphate aldolase class I [Gemmatimonadetes bacterium]|nr:fructose-bisphosphate aldolase class I [Gemmatimonadota bacterium]MYH20383.1 fructose-bisphosphate aldolase class I [Gemmatimonadota bacterium]MYK99213.1 fructose-bisphosphate aldolase class I [Gemmatimonadota bacterium]
MSSKLSEVARAMVAPDKGILAADESSGTIRQRFNAIGLPSTKENRRAYRHMLFTTEGMEQFISGVILYDETLRQKALDEAETPFPRLLSDKGVIPGIKVDTGIHDLAGFPGEKVTEGLDGLRARLTRYGKLGAQFAKWRAVITVGKGIPTDVCIDANAHALARYAALCQECGIVPIVEPEVLMDGDHNIYRCDEVTGVTLRQVFEALAVHEVKLDGIVLKPSMVISGSKCPEQASVEEVARRTVNNFLRNIPREVPGVAFLSGGQSSETATAHLNAMNHMFGELPWGLSFSFGRALQAAPLRAWGGDPARFKAGQEAFFHRAMCNSAARTGTYSADMETAA